MKVDFSSPLTNQERGYLEARGLYADIERADNMHGVETPAFGAGDGTGLQQVSLMTSEQRASERERLLARLAEIGGDSETAGTDEDAEPDPYEVWEPADLKAEIDRRNQESGREVKISKAGSKQDLADRLYADDEQAAQNPA
jgi:hypothetical protein